MCSYCSGLHDMDSQHRHTWPTRMLDPTINWLTSTVNSILIGLTALQIFLSCVLFPKAGSVDDGAIWSSVQLFSSTPGEFLSPLRVGAWSKLFLAIGPEKEYPKLVLKFWGLPQINLGGGVKFSPNFVIFRRFRPFLRNGARCHQSENGLANYGHFPTIWWNKKAYYRRDCRAMRRQK